MSNKEQNFDEQGAVQEQFFEQNSPMPPEKSIGKLLLEARIAAGLTVEDVASRLHLKIKLVNDIEADNFNNIIKSTNATYARGYVRSYARIMDVSDEQILACLEYQLPSKVEPVMQSFSRKTTLKTRDHRLMLITWGIALLLLALLVIWWFQKPSNSQAINLAHPTVEEVAAAGELGSGSSTELTESAAAAVLSPNIGGDIAPAQNEQLSETDVVSKPHTQGNGLEQASTGHLLPQDPEAVDLSVKLNGDCWMKVEDATGKTLIHGVKAAGRKISVTGEPPLNIVIGAPQVVSLTFNGQNVDLANYPAGKVARFTLPRS